MNKETAALHSKICDAKVPLALFVKNGAVRTTKITSALFAEMVIKRAPELMGVYDKDCRIEWLSDDLKYMGGSDE